MNVYDFDGTIYDGDSSVDFFKYCSKKNKRCLKILPKFIFFLFLYYLKIVEKEKLKSVFFGFVKCFDNIDDLVSDFWKDNEFKLKDFYTTQKKRSDVIISASPEFLLKPVAKKYDFVLIASEVNKKTGVFIGKNCYGEEKVSRFKKKFKDSKVVGFYSDSLSDEPLARISNEAYIVSGNEVISWKEYKVSFLKKVKNFILDRDFITFCAIGVINVFNGVWIAYVLSLLIDNAVVAYIFGFSISMCISYVLNSVLNFKNRLSFKALFRFSISNVPNFIIQILSVVISIDMLHWPKLVSYIISACIAVPITFVLVKLFVYKKGNDTRMENKKSKELKTKSLGERIQSILLLVFIFIFLFYPTSYGLIDLRVLIIFSAILVILSAIFKNFRFRINEKYYIWIILFLAIITRVGVVLSMESSIEQVSDFSQALNLAHDFSLFSDKTLYYQSFTHWILYPVLVNLVFKVFGAGQLVALLVNATVLVGVAVLLYKLASCIFKNKRYGFYAALLYVMWPANIFYTLIFTQEHLGALLLLTALYLFVLCEAAQEFKYNWTKYLYYLSIGIVLGLSVFFKNFAPVFIVAFIIYYFLKALQVKNVRSFVWQKAILILIIGISFWSTKSLIYLGLDELVGESVVRNITPCYLNVGLRGTGVYDAGNYQMYSDALLDANFDYKKANADIMNGLVEYLKSEDATPRKMEFWDNKADILFGGDARIYWVKASVSSPIDHPTIIDVLSKTEKYNLYYFVILVFLMVLGTVEMFRKKHMELFLLYLIFFGSFLLLILVEAQNRYMYSIQTIMCILAIPGFLTLKEFIQKNITEKL